MTDQTPDPAVASAEDRQADAALRALFIRADAPGPSAAAAGAGWSAAVMAQIAAEAAARQRRLDLTLRVGGAITALCLAAALPFAPAAIAHLAAGLPGHTGLPATMPDALFPALSIATATACLAALAILTRPAVGERQGLQLEQWAVRPAPRHVFNQRQPAAGGAQAASEPATSGS